MSSVLRSTLWTEVRHEWEQQNHARSKEVNNFDDTSVRAYIRMMICEAQKIA